ncbi:MAG: glycosyltransferase family 2 protein [Clostridiales bacterium]|jgi:glycosyltransferase involved in cell wall biosynthesis|nr:glycosyltransferase family 2 protein [Clostridiales bacterium]
MKNDLISIIVPIYCVEPYLNKCVDSILNQTYKNIEVILVDDGSPDECPAICDKFASQDSRVKVVHKANGGLVSARKAGISVASGQYIGYVDGDDWIEPDMYEKMYLLAIKHDADVIATGHFRNINESYTIMKNGIDSGVYKGVSLRDIVYPKLIYSGRFYEHGILGNIWNKLFKRSVILPHQLAVSDDIKYCEDVACVLPTLLSAKSIVIDNHPYYHYRQRLGSITKKYDTDEIVRLKALFNYLYRCISKSEYFQILYSQFRYFILHKTLYRCPYIFWTQDSMKPFDCVSRNSRIVLYGAGDFGQALYSSIKSTGFCKIALWTDRFSGAYAAQGLPVDSIDLIRSVDYDHVVMAAMNIPETAKKETIYLLAERNVPYEKIVWISDKYINNPELIIREMLNEL